MSDKTEKGISLGISNTNKESQEKIARYMSENEDFVGISIRIEMNKDTLALAYKLGGKDGLKIVANKELQENIDGYIRSSTSIEEATAMRGKIVIDSVTNVADFNRGVDFALLVLRKSVAGIEENRKEIISNALTRAQSMRSKNNGEA